MRTIERSHLFVALASALSLAAPAAAQDVLEEVIVTAQKRSENMLDIPVAMNALSGVKVDEEFITGVESLTRLAPSLTILDDDISIRGIGTGGFALQVEPTVAFSIDGVVLARTSQAFINLIDVERIEVLRGPQGTLFGKNSSAGLVQIITRRPSREALEGEAELQLIEDDQYIFRGALSGPLTDSTAAGLSVYYEDNDGFTPNPSVSGKNNGEETYTVRGKIDSDLTDNINLLVTGYVRESDKTGPDLQWRSISEPALQDIVSGLGVTADDENETSTSDGQGFENTDEWSLQAELNWDVGDFTLTSLSAYMEWEIETRDDVDEQPTPIRETRFYYFTPSPFGNVGPVNFQQRVGQTIDQFSQELRLTSPAGEKLEYIVGAYFQTYELDDSVRRDFDLCTLPGLILGFPPGPPSPSLVPGQACVDPTFSIISLTDASRLVGFPDVNGQPALTVAEVVRNVKGDNYAVFGQGTYRFTDALALTAGMRYQYDETDLDFEVTIPNIVPGWGFGPAATLSDSVSGDGASGKLALQYDVTDDTMVYGSYARGYKGPTGVFEGGAIADIDAETSDNFEVGLRTAILDNRGFVALTGFWSDYENFQEEQFSAVEQTFILSNVGEVRSRGVELETRANIGEHWVFDAAVSYVDATIEDYPGGPCYVPVTSDPGCVFTPGPGGTVSTTKDLAGGDMPNSPDWKYYVSGRYQRDLGGSNLRVFGQLSYAWQDEVNYSISQNPLTVQDDYGILNGNIGFGSQDGTYQVTLFARNLLDEDYVTNVFQDFIIGYSANTLHYRPKDAERIFGIAFRGSF
ncbi:TonB-dependent receptor [Pseudohalioglobus sediminis]|uniref:TonB-dependent receptor n=1 Tax=Pseudohalioglobus sediminis TaxID=2606449 RepID=A0A5B0X1H5_9GAMM|nr:TonB-dependent receptor [Pseudohalioglobus sediminis]KAA1192498.1 TonB-dependent receptor [Pseudohalioglobus sediminis]